MFAPDYRSRTGPFEQPQGLLGLRRLMPHQQHFVGRTQSQHSIDQFGSATIPVAFLCSPSFERRWMLHQQHPFLYSPWLQHCFQNGAGEVVVSDLLFSSV